MASTEEDARSPTAVPAGSSDRDQRDESGERPEIETSTRAKTTPDGECPEGWEKVLRYYTQFKFRCPIQACKKYNKPQYKKNRRDDCVTSGAWHLCDAQFHSGDDLWKKEDWNAVREAAGQCVEATDVDYEVWRNPETDEIIDPYKEKKKAKEKQKEQDDWGGSTGGSKPKAAAGRSRPMGRGGGGDRHRERDRGSGRRSLDRVRTRGHTPPRRNRDRSRDDGRDRQRATLTERGHRNERGSERSERSDRSDRGGERTDRGGDDRSERSRSPANRRRDPSHYLGDAAREMEMISFNQLQMRPLQERMQVLRGGEIILNAMELDEMIQGLQRSENACEAIVGIFQKATKQFQDEMNVIGATKMMLQRYRRA